MQKTQRVRYWDIVKGLTIILMILGHQSGLPYPVYRMIFSFHMPLFFIANAYFIKEYNVENTLKKSVITLIKPYVIVCLLSAVLAQFVYTGGVDISIFVNKIKAMLGGVSYVNKIFVSFESVWQVWFVICLFFSRNIYVMLMKIMKKLPEEIRLIIIIVISYFGAKLGQSGYWLLWSLDVSLAALIFMWFGDELHKKSVIESKCFSVVAILSFVIWCALTANDLWIELSIRSYKGGAVSFLNAIAGSIVIIGLSIMVDRLGQMKYCAFVNVLDDGLAWVGNKSMIVLAVHMLGGIYLGQYIPMFIPMYLQMGWISQFLVRFALILFVTIIYESIKNVFMKKRGRNEVK